MSDEFTPLDKNYFNNVWDATKHLSEFISIEDDVCYRRMVLSMLVQQTLLLDKISHILLLAHGIDISDANHDTTGDLANTINSSDKPLTCPNCNKQADGFGYCPKCKMDLISYYKNKT